MEVVPLYVERLHLCLADLEAFLVMARIKRALNFEAGFGCRCRDGLDHSNATCQRPGAPSLGNMTE